MRRSRRARTARARFRPTQAFARSARATSARRPPSSTVRAMSEVEGQIEEEELDAERDARRRFALAQIRQYPDAALKIEARPVEEFDDDLRRLVVRMKQLMADAH